MNNSKLTQVTPVTETSMLPDSTEVTAWDSAKGALTTAGTYWLSTTQPDGRPHVMRILAVWAENAVHFSTSPNSRKGRNLARNPHCVITTTADGFDLVVEGTAVRVTEDHHLKRIADEYERKYGWKVNVRDGAFHDAEGAPTAGPPPYHVFRIETRVAFSLGAEDGDSFSPTRWTFHLGTR